MLLSVSCCNVLRRFGGQIASFAEGETQSFFNFSIQTKAQTFNKNHAKMDSKIHRKPTRNGVPEGPKWGPGGSLERPGPLPRAHFDFVSIFESILGPFWDPFGTTLGPKVVKKSIWGGSKSPKRLNTLLDGFQHDF